MVISLAVRALFFTVLWLALTDGMVTPVPLVAFILVAVTGMSFLYRGPVRWRWRLKGVVRFVPFFLFHSLAGGLDVGTRAFRRKVPLAPAFLKYEMQLRPSDPSALFFLAVLNLLPGTLCAAMEEGILTIHVVDTGQANEERLRRLEASVGLLFGQPLAMPGR